MKKKIYTKPEIHPYDMTPCHIISTSVYNNAASYNAAKRNIWGEENQQESEPSFWD